VRVYNRSYLCLCVFDTDKNLTVDAESYHIEDEMVVINPNDKMVFTADVLYTGENVDELIVDITWRCGNCSEDLMTAENDTVQITTQYLGVNVTRGRIESILGMIHILLSTFDWLCVYFDWLCVF